VLRAIIHSACYPHDVRSLHYMVYGGSDALHEHHNRLCPEQYERAMMRARVIPAALVALTLLCAAALVFIDPFSGAPSMGPPVAAVIRAGGVTMSVRVPPGPYFLSELLPVDVALSNHSHAPIKLGGAAVPSPCGSALGAWLMGGTAPHFALRASTTYGCPPFAGGMTTVAPGHALTIRQWLPLTASGHLTLMAGAQFLKVSTTSGGGQAITTDVNSLGGRWPSLVLTVAPTIPANRTLTLIKIGPAVFVHVPLRLRSQLRYLYGVSCRDAQGPGGTGTGNFGWQPLASGVAYDPGCPGIDEQWTVAIGLPGYAIATATYPGRGEAKV
jgi:hypothetical protein